MKVVVVIALVVAITAVEVDPMLGTECQDWVINNQKDMIVLKQAAASSHISSCAQYCMVASSGFRADTTTCRSLCDLSGGYSDFAKAFEHDSDPTTICSVLLNRIKAKTDEETAPVSLLETSSMAVSERKLGVRGDMTVQGTLSTSMLTSPIGDVKVSGEMNVMNQISSNTARAAFLKADAGVSIRQGIVSKKEQLLVKGRIDADSVTANSMHYSFLEIEGVRQWALHSLEDFEETEPLGWSDKELTECAGRRLLGGHCAGDSPAKEVSKTFAGLPEHTQIRINAQYIFLDSWDGESGYLKVNGNIVWTETYNHKDGDDGRKGINVCGNETPEKKFNRAVDVVIPHTGDSLTIAFGATTDEHPCDESFGVDSVMVFVR